MLNNFARVNKLLYRSSGPSPADVKFLKDLGINKIVSLDKEMGDKIKRTTKLLNIDHILLPIEIGNRKSLLRFLQQDLFSLLQDNGPVAISCAAGKDRTGLACALFRCRYQSWPASAAIKEAKSFGFGIGVDPSIIHLYTKLIHDSAEKRHSDVNDGDIVSNEREAASNYDDYEGGNREQSSWSPFADYRVREYPFTPTDSSKDYDEQYDSRQTRGLSDASEDREYEDGMPQVGQYSSITSLVGAGPSMIGSGFVD
jgi:hypothetical protein